MTNSFSLFAVFISGLCALVYQIVWQRYLSLLFGSETQSISIMVATFLLGLAWGSYYWGKFSQQTASRQKTVRTYGMVEIGIGLFAMLFPILFELLSLVDKLLPDFIVSKIIVASITFIPPTFLMGASIPMLVACLPSRGSDINGWQAKLYGVNTLGAFLGVNLAAYILIPQLGLSYSLIVCGVANVLLGVYFFKMKLPEAMSFESTDISIKSSFKSYQIYFVSGMAGMIAICLEILLIRVGNLQ